MKNRKITPEIADLIIEKFNAGYDYAKIGKAASLSETTIYRFVKKHNLSNKDRVKRPKTTPPEEEKGKKYNHLTILNFFLDYEKRWWFADCVCDCGRSAKELLRKLKNGERKTCGDSSCSFHCELRKHNGRSTFTGYKEILGSKWACWRLGALKRKIPFEITIEQAWGKFLKQKRKCALSGIDLSFNSCYKKADGNASLDRIDSSKAYTLDNIQWVHKHINIMKSNFSEDYFLDLCQKVVQHGQAIN